MSSSLISLSIVKLDSAFYEYFTICIVILLPFLSFLAVRFPVPFTVQHHFPSLTPPTAIPVYSTKNPLHRQGKGGFSKNTIPLKE